MHATIAAVCSASFSRVIRRRGAADSCGRRSSSVLGAASRVHDDDGCSSRPAHRLSLSCCRRVTHSTPFSLLSLITSFLPLLLTPTVLSLSCVSCSRVCHFLRGSAAKHIVINNRPPFLLSTATDSKTRTLEHEEHDCGYKLRGKPRHNTAPPITAVKPGHIRSTIV